MSQTTWIPFNVLPRTNNANKQLLRRRTKFNRLKLDERFSVVINKKDLGLSLLKVCSMLVGLIGVNLLLACITQITFNFLIVMTDFLSKLS